MHRVAFTHLRDMGPLPTLVEQGRGTSALEEIFASEGLPVAAAYEREGYVPVRTMVSLMERAARSLGDDHFGIRLGLQMAPTDFGLWVRYVIGAPTVGAMIRRSARTLPYHNSGASFDLTVAPPYAKWRTTICGLDAGYRHFSDHVIGPMMTAMRLYLGTHWKPSWIEVSYARPACWQEIEAAFGTEVKFGRAATAAIAFPDELLGVRMQSPPPTMSVVTCQDLHRIARSRAPRSIVDAVSAVVSLRLLEGQSDLDGTARLMGVGPRMLQRQLDEVNTRYRDLLESVRISRARSLIEASAMTLTEIALEVGYSDASGFSRAFRRHAGIPPSQLRRTERALEG